MGNAIIPMKMFKKGHNRFPEITEFFFLNLKEITL